MTGFLICWAGSRIQQQQIPAALHCLSSSYPSFFSRFFFFFLSKNFTSDSTTDWTTKESRFEYGQQQRHFLFPQLSKPVLGTTGWGGGRETDNSTPSGVEIEWSYTSTPPIIPTSRAGIALPLHLLAGLIRILEVFASNTGQDADDILRRLSWVSTLYCVTTASFHILSISLSIRWCVADFPKIYKPRQYSGRHKSGVVLN